MLRFSYTGEYNQVFIQFVIVCVLRCGSTYVFMYFFYFSSINKKALICNAKILFLFISEFYYTPYGLTQKAMPENFSFREILMTKDRTYVSFF